MNDELLIFPIAFEDEKGDRFVCYTYGELDFALGHKDWTLIFD